MGAGRDDTRPPRRHPRSSAKTVPVRTRIERTLETACRLRGNPLQVDGGSPGRRPPSNSHGRPDNREREIAMRTSKRPAASACATIGLSH